MKRILIVLLFGFSQCEFFDNPIRVCESSTPNLIVKLISVRPSDQCERPNGAVNLEVKNGTPPFLFRLNGAKPQASGNFTNVFAGEHSVQITDAYGCEGSLIVMVPPAGSVVRAVVSATPDNTCFSNSGTLTISAQGGVPPYTYRIDSLGFSPDSTIYRLDKGVYWVRVRDSRSCQYQLFTRVEHGDTGVSYAKHVQPLINLYCAYAGCHNGDVGIITNFTIFNTVRSFGSLIVRYSGTNHLPKAVPDNEIQYVRCWIEDGKPFN
jgi:SprB repeat